MAHADCSQRGGRNGLALMPPLVLLSALVAIFWLTVEVHAELATTSETIRVCKNWLSLIVHEKGSWAGSESPQIVGVKDLKEGDLLLARCYSIAPSGFVVVSMLKELPPVKMFAEQGSLESHPEHGIGALLTDVLADRFDKFIECYGSLDAAPTDENRVLFDVENRQAWERLLRSRDEFEFYLKSSRTPAEQVGPLLSTAWHQLEPYSNYCPMGDGRHCVVWCVATALAQIIWYHQWPPAGFGWTTYHWDGDTSCGGFVPGRQLYANFSDRYGYGGSIHEMAEVCAEVGKAYHVQYGACWSIGSPYPIFDLLPDNFAYRDTVEQLHRSAHTATQWFETIQDEINKSQPVDYLIYNHKIVADGWMTVAEQNYYHMNYGWGGGSNGWYAIDGLYCDWAGCDPMFEVMWINIIPDREIMFYADTIAGQRPLNLQFTASSDKTVDSWTWDFGDGDSAFTQMPSHTYTTAGIYDVSLSISHDGTNRAKTRTEYIYVTDDSVAVSDGAATPGQKVEVTVSGNNLMPLSRMELPVEYDGDLDLTFDSLSTAGCRSVDFQNVSLLDSDPANKRLTVVMEPWVAGESLYPYLAADAGDLLKMYFTVSPTATPWDETSIRMNAYDSFGLRYFGSIYGFEHIYQPTAIAGSISIQCSCPYQSDFDEDGFITALDLASEIDVLFAGLSDLSDPGCPTTRGDFDCDGFNTALDLAGVIDHLFSGADGPGDPCSP